MPVNITKTAPGQITAYVGKGKRESVDIQCTAPFPGIDHLVELEFGLLLQLWNNNISEDNMMSILEQLPTFIPPWSTIHMQCTCEKPGGECTHTAAAWSIFANSINQQPSLLLRFRDYSPSIIFEAAMRFLGSVVGAQQEPILYDPTATENFIAPVSQLQEKLPATTGTNRPALSLTTSTLATFWHGDLSAISSDFCISKNTESPGWFEYVTDTLWQQQTPQAPLNNPSTIESLVSACSQLQRRARAALADTETLESLR
jgi:hypothetical protein